MRGIVLNWHNNYSYNRKKEKNLEIINLIGVQQGSIFRHLLSIMYINDIYNASENLNFVLYADDTTFYITHNGIVILFNHTDIELKKLYNL